MTETEIMDALVEARMKWVVQAIYGGEFLDNETRINMIQIFLNGASRLDSGLVLEVVKRLTGR